MIVRKCLYVWGPWKIFGTLSLQFSSTARNLGVYFDSNLSFNKQIVVFLSITSAGESEAVFNLWVEVAMHALISSRLNYCNALCIAHSSLTKPSTGAKCSNSPFD